MTRRYLNLDAGAWKQVCKNWDLPASPMLLWQRLVPGSLFSLLNTMQTGLHRDELAKANLSACIVVLGYWRSGTTLLHELLCRDTRYSFPTTYACMNPHHFLMTEAGALAKTGVAVQRPMDEMTIGQGSPQEDEFALLSMGARSPYEALLVPQQLDRALMLADPRDLRGEEEQQWRAIFLSFLRGVWVRGGGRPLILKSPTHGFRVATLRELLPDARFILIVRDPATHFESVVRMWRKMFETYSVGTMPSDDEIRESVISDRLRFECKLAAGTEGLPVNRFATLTYESLVADPITVCARLYGQLDLGDFLAARNAIAAESDGRREYKARGTEASAGWRERIGRDWAPVFTQYGYDRR